MLLYPPPAHTPSPAPVQPLVTPTLITPPPTRTSTPTPDMFREKTNHYLVVSLPVRITSQYQTIITLSQKVISFSDIYHSANLKMLNETPKSD